MHLFYAKSDSCFVCGYVHSQIMFLANYLLDPLQGIVTHIQFIIFRNVTSLIQKDNQRSGINSRLLHFVQSVKNLDKIKCGHSL